MCDTQKYPTVPENADKILFAEDFVNHILHRYNLPLLSSGIAEHRADIRNAFNTEVRVAADKIYDHCKNQFRNVFSDIIKPNPIDVDAFHKYAINLAFEIGPHRMLPIVKGIRHWFEFCINVSSIAAQCYQRGVLDAPRLAVDYIINIINDTDMVEERGWGSLNWLAAEYDRNFEKTINNNKWTSEESASDITTRRSSCSTDYMSTDPSSNGNSDDSRSPDHEMDCGDDKERYPEKSVNDDLYKMCLAGLGCSSEEPVSSSSACIPVEETANEISENIVSIYDNASVPVSSKLSQNKKSVNPRSPDLEMQGGVDQYELPEKLTDDGVCTRCLAAMSSSSEGPVYSMCTHVEKTIEVVSENTVSLPENTSDSISSGSPKDKNSDTSCHSFEQTSSEDDISKRKVRKKKNMKRFNFYSKISSSDSEKGEAYPKTMDCNDSFTRQLNEKHSAVLSSPKNEHNKSDSAHHIKTSNSRNLTPEDMSISSMEEEDRI